jgi:hypothetical protein
VEISGRRLQAGRIMLDRGFRECKRVGLVDFVGLARIPHQPKRWSNARADLIYRSAWLVTGNNTRLGSKKRRELVNSIE